MTIPLWVYIVTVVILLGIIIRELKVNHDITESYETSTVALGYMALRFYYTPTIEDIENAVGISPEKLKKLMEGDD
jgi:hypothetical protein